jgi:voltage-gated potassium channel
MAWVACVVMEVVWQSVLTVSPDLAVHLCAPHLVLWLLLLPYMLWSLMNALAEEPVFSGPVLMGAAGGYLLVGFTGGIVLNTLMVLEPAAFDLPQTSSRLATGIAHAPTVLGAAFGCLTTLGSPVLRLDHLSVLIASVAIVVVGQLYIAILIAGVLGKPRQLAAVRKAAVRRSTASRRQGIKRVSRSRR